MFLKCCENKILTLFNPFNTDSLKCTCSHLLMAHKLLQVTRKCLHEFLVILKASASELLENREDMCIQYHFIVIYLAGAAPFMTQKLILLSRKYFRKFRRIPKQMTWTLS